MGLCLNAYKQDDWLCDRRVAPQHQVWNVPRPFPVLQPHQDDHDEDVQLLGVGRKHHCQVSNPLYCGPVIVYVRATD